MHTLLLVITADDGSHWYMFLGMFTLIVVVMGLRKILGISDDG